MHSTGITSFRALAFLAVFLFHAGGSLYLEIGYLGVQAFFVLSGFLLTALLLTCGISMLNYEFMERRLIDLKDRYFARSKSHPD